MTTFRWDKVGKAIARLVSTRAARDLNNITDEGKEKIKELAGEVGTYDYNDMTNVPLINNVPLRNQLSLDDLGVQAQGNYVEQSELESYALKSDLSEYATQDDLTDLALKSELEGFLTESDLSDYATKDEIPSLTSSDFQPFDGTKAYNKGDWVIVNLPEGKAIYESLVNDNINNSLYDESKWLKLEAITGASSYPFFYGINKYFPVSPNNACWLHDFGQGFQKIFYPGYYNWILSKAIKDQNNFKVAKLYRWQTADDAYTFWTSTNEPQLGTVVYGGGVGDMKLYGTVVELVENGFTFENNIEQNTLETVFLIDGNLRDNELITDYDYVVDTQNETFKLPKKNGEENLPSGEIIENIFPQEIGTTRVSYTIPANGFVFVAGLSTGGSLQVFKNNRLIENGGASSANIYNANIFCLKGDVIGIQNDTGTRSGIISYFEYAKGNGDLYHYIGKIETNNDFTNVVNELPTKVNAAEAAHAVAPSNIYIDVPVTATNQDYKSPADGYICLKSDGIERINLTNTSNGLLMSCVGGESYGPAITMYVSKDDIVRYNFTGSASIVHLRFVYANGSKPATVNEPLGEPGGESGGSLTD